MEWEDETANYNKPSGFLQKLEQAEWKGDKAGRQEI